VNNSSDSIFSSFTNQYSLSKTLRFELKPIGKTQQMLDEAQVFKKDEIIKKKYEATKPYFDRLHRKFVKESLESAEIPKLEEYFKIFKKWKLDKKNNEKELQRRETELRKFIVSKFNEKAEQWATRYPGLKNKNIEILSEESVFKSLLKPLYGNEEESFLKDEEGNFIVDEQGNKISVFDSWKGFTGYFTRFFETRKNFYKDDGTSATIATRIIEQNLRRFCNNLLIFEEVKNNVNFSEVEENFEIKLCDFFSPNFYISCLLQDGIELYNKILGGETLSSGEKKKGLNECINLHRQKTEKKLPFFKSLDKQILSEKEKFIDEIETDEELLDVLTTFYKSAEEKISVLKNLFDDFVKNWHTHNLSQIYIEEKVFNPNSCKYVDRENLESFQELLFIAMKEAKIVSSSAKKKDGEYSLPDFIPLSFIKGVLEDSPNENFWKDRYYISEENKRGFLSLTSKENIWTQFLKIFDYEFSSLFENELHNTQTGKSEKIGYNIFRQNFKIVLENFKNNTENKVIIKNFADSVLTIYQIAKYFSLEKRRVWNESGLNEGDFYTNPEYGYLNFYENAYEEIVQVYNKIRNYLTRNPYSKERWKLNFENPTLANGWDKNKESDNSTVILRKDGKYFLGIMAKGHNKIFDDRFKQDFSNGLKDGKYEKVIYKFFPDQAKMFPKVCFSKKGLNVFEPSKDIYSLYKNSEFKKGETFSLKSMHKLIDFYKKCLTKYEGWTGYNFRNLKPTEKYKENIGEFFKDVAKDSYKISFQEISESYIHEKNQKGELYLFQIKNKDWNKGTKGRKNLHTLYFESLFSEENISQNFPMKLNGQAEIFYRPKTDINKLGTKKDKRDKTIVDHKRYSENKIFFHIPLTINRTKGDARYFNTQINNFLANNKKVNIIGIDRGEKHLAYYSLINQSGNVIDSGSLNIINNTNYENKLIQKAINREQERKDWLEIEGIKNLKKGYISQVIKKIADLAIKYNAIIVFEDLNMRFKQIRGGIEKSTYQQLEKALIEKLNFLVNKNEMNPQKAGHLLKAYQLTAPFSTFKEMGKQTGIIFYTQASYTSKIDPITGWRPNLYLKYSSAEKAKNEILKFTDIKFHNNRFKFTYDIKNFKQQNEYPQKTIWTICSNVERFRWNKKLNQNKGGYDHYEEMTDYFIDLFETHEIDLNKNILDQIKILQAKGNEEFFKKFIFYLNLVCQIRNTDEKATEINKQDFILSPVEPFFDSRNPEKFGKNLPQNGDDNGAYNIARKGIIILDKISNYAKAKGDCEKLGWNDLYVSQTDWDNFVQT